MYAQISHPPVPHAEVWLSIYPAGHIASHSPLPLTEAAFQLLPHAARISVACFKEKPPMKKKCVGYGKTASIEIMCHLCGLQGQVRPSARIVADLTTRDVTRLGKLWGTAAATQTHFIASEQYVRMWLHVIGFKTTLGWNVIKAWSGHSPDI